MSNTTHCPHCGTDPHPQYHICECEGKTEQIHPAMQLVLVVIGFSVAFLGLLLLIGKAL